MHACGDSGREEGKGSIRTCVYGQVPSTPGGDGKVTCLVGGVRATCLMPLGRLWVFTGLQRWLRAFHRLPIATRRDRRLLSWTVTQDARARVRLL